MEEKVKLLLYRGSLGVFLGVEDLGILVFRAFRV